jgi:hypothetical protein
MAASSASACLSHSSRTCAGACAGMGLTPAAAGMRPYQFNVLDDMPCAPFMDGFESDNASWPFMRQPGLVRWVDVSLGGEWGVAWRGAVGRASRAGGVDAGCARACGCGAQACGRVRGARRRRWRWCAWAARRGCARWWRWWHHCRAGATPPMQRAMHALDWTLPMCAWRFTPCKVRWAVRSAGAAAPRRPEPSLNATQVVVPMQHPPGPWNQFDTPLRPFCP